MLTELFGLIGFFTVHAFIGVAILATGAGVSWLTGRMVFRLK